MNRIHQPKTSRFAKNINVKAKKVQEHPKVNVPNIIQNIPNIPNVPQQPSKRSLNIIDLNLKNHDNFLEFKSAVEENISYLKDQLNKTNEISIENKNGLNQALELIQHLNEQITKYTDQAEEYKQITNERIEKLVKLFLLVNNKLSTLSNLNL